MFESTESFWGVFQCDTWFMGIFRSLWFYFLTYKRMFQTPPPKFRSTPTHNLHCQLFLMVDFCSINCDTLPYNTKFAPYFQLKWWLWSSVNIIVHRLRDCIKNFFYKLNGQWMKKERKNIRDGKTWWNHAAFFPGQRVLHHHSCPPGVDWQLRLKDMMTGSREI